VHTGRPLRMRTLVTDAARLTIYDGLAHGELFDRADDPDELRNLYGLPEAAALQAALTNQLTREMLSHSDVSPRPTAFA
ncbi:MAG: sulfatase, partial [Alphaproteobacteria bacterium]